MPTSFSRSLRSLEADRFRWNLIGIGIGLGLLAMWTAWLFLARVALYEVSDRARLEVDREPHAIMSLVPGRVLDTAMTLGRDVSKGELLLQLDASEIRFQLEAVLAEKSGAERQRERLQGELGAQQRALKDLVRAGHSAVGEAEARYEESRLAARTAQQDADRKKDLHENLVLSESEMEFAETAASTAAKAAEAQRLQIDRLRNRLNSEESEKLAEVAALERALADLTASLQRLDADQKRLEHEVSLYRLTAPVAGRIGDVEPIQVGEVIERHRHLGTIIPSGDVRVVAEFVPRRAMGRVAADQRGKLRLEGFSWVQYGSVPATVRRVASEPQGGTVRVELSLDDPDAFPVPLQHGLPGVLEVEVERISPAQLLLRAAGNVVSRPVNSSPE